MSLIQVRKLAWETYGDTITESNARSAYGLYRVWHPFDEFGFQWMLLNETEWQPVESLDAAIAACQADFERRVLAEIEVVPPHQTFDQWWDDIWFSLDPDTEDVPWDDKLKEFARYAWNAAKTGKHWVDPSPASDGRKGGE